MVARFYCLISGEAKRTTLLMLDHLKLAVVVESKDILNLIKLYRRIMLTGEKIYSMHQMTKLTCCPSNYMATAF